MTRLTGRILTAVAVLLLPWAVPATAAAGSFEYSYRCDGEIVTTPGPENVGKLCTILANGPAADGQVHEIRMAIRQRDLGYVWMRATLYTTNGKAESHPFVVPEGEFELDAHDAAFAQGQAGTQVRLMTWNLLGGGKLDGKDYTGENLKQLIEYVNEVNPDIFFVVEAYGSETAILQGLNAGRASTDLYNSVPITVAEEAKYRNLWLFTKLKVAQRYTERPEISDFHFGGAKLLLPDGKPIHAFTIWSRHEDSVFAPMHHAVVNTQFGKPVSPTIDTIVGYDDTRRNAQGQAILQKVVPYYVKDDAPVLIGGDFNAWSYRDWTGQFADARGHAGLTVPWTYTKQFADAGFYDTFRYINPDAGLYPGRTWSTMSGFGIAPARIDYLLFRDRKAQVRVLGARTDVRRLPRHQGGYLDQEYPFYSDHGAVIADLLITGTGPGPNRPIVMEKPEYAPGAWPAPPAGNPIPPSELSATASTFKPVKGDAKRAVDGDPFTYYHSWYPDAADPTVSPAQPHTITVDMGRERVLSGVRFVPKLSAALSGAGNPVVNMTGTPLRGVLEVSTDGTWWAQAASVTWPRITGPNDVPLNGVRARYLRLRVDNGMGGATSIAEITPYE
ncbi:hypothetical protein FH608_006170 [Nonomuraea phyllanthi]|uniref:Uncharacterized protein n=1 Tax=Nonomuraea phyllanthi TaxID=2219224 RepID=A0A5C4WS04_9ACTN|nr:endonuclease/exonuclease/phosphatase family protein [Nonomuraea phyllanthi]KAB8196343.1 hypothetical protein FH608_006170 [Nonomuraea phyllanthi]